MNNSLTVDNTFLISPDQRETFMIAVSDFNASNNSYIKANLLSSEKEGLLYEVTGMIGIDTLSFVLGLSERLKAA